VVSETIAEIVAAASLRDANPGSDDRAHLRAHPRARRPAIFITLRDEADALTEAKALAARGTDLRSMACRSR